MHEQLRSRAPGRTLPALAWLGVWLVVAAAVVLPYVNSYRHLSPFDELVHVDYVVKAQHFDLVQGGEKVGQTAMREQACRGHDIEVITFPPCRSSEFDPDAFPEYGFNTAYSDPPLYYAVTAGGASAVDLVPGIDSVVTAARSIGVIWLGAGLALTFLLARRLGATSGAAAGATLIVACAPAIAHASATVTSDAALLASGALLCLVALGVVEGRLRWWWLLPAAAVAGAVKATSLTILGVVVLYLLLQLVRSRDVAEPETDDRADRQSDHPQQGPTAPRATLLAATAVAVGGLVAIGGWMALTAVTALPEASAIPMRDTFKVSGLDWSAHIDPNVTQLLSPLQAGYLPPFMVDSTLDMLMRLVNLLLVATLVAVSWYGSRAAQATRLAVATLAGMVLSGPALVLVIFVGSHTYIPIPSRYGLSLVPAVAACLAVAASRRRAGTPILLVLGLGSLAALMAHTV